MNIENAFAQLNISTLLGVELLNHLGMTTDDLHLPQRFAKLQSVISYLKKFPEDTQRFLINKATRGKPVDKLDHIYDYVNILREKSDYEEQLSKLSEEMFVLDEIGDVHKMEHLQSQIDFTQHKLNLLSEEQEIYE